MDTDNETPVSQIAEAPGRRAKRIKGGLFICLVVGLLFLRLLMNPALRDPAVAIVPFSVDKLDYRWRSNDEFIYFTDEENDENRRLIMAQNARTGLPKYLRQITISAVDRGTEGDGNLSPDGKRMLTASRDANGQPIWLTYSLESEEMVEWPRHLGSGGLGADWLADSQHWVEITSFPDKTELRIRDITEPESDGALTIINESFWGSFLGINAENKGVIFGAFYGHKKQIDYIQFDVGDRPGWFKRHTLQMPPDGELLSMDLSPRGQKMVLALRYTYDMRRDELHIFTITLGDTALKEVKVIPGAFVLDHPTITSPTIIHWLPDSKRISLSTPDGIAIFKVD